MSREIFEIFEDEKVLRGRIASAIQLLREKRGYSKAKMARLFDIGERLYQSWEAGEHVPGGLNIVRMINLCPDSECLKAFGIDLAKYRVGEKEEETKLRGVFLEPTELPKRRTQH